MKKNNIKIVVAIIGLIAAVLSALIISGVFFPRKILELRVIDSETQIPIGNAIVKLEDDTKQTGSDGIVIFYKLRKGYKEYFITKEDYNEFKGTVRISGKDNFQEVQIILADELIPDTPAIIFQEPEDESVQISPVTLIGSSSNLPTDKHYWIVVNPHGTNGWWPQTGEIMIKPNNKWSGTAQLGGVKGQKFDIHFILVDNVAHNDFNNYLSECAKTGNYPEEPLPNGAKSLGYITITKK